MKWDRAHWASSAPSLIWSNSSRCSTVRWRVACHLRKMDVDGFAADVFYTDQGIWAGSTAWEEVNFSSYGRAFYSTSNFETATEIPMIG